MKEKKITIIFVSAAIIVVALGLVLICRNRILRNNRIEIIDASYMCAEALEKFYEDDNYTYSFPCVKSGSVYVKFPNGKKMLVVTALEEKLVTIDQLINAGLEVYKKEK